MPGKFNGMIPNRKAPAGSEKEASAAVVSTAKKVGRPKKGQSKTDSDDYRVTTLRAHIDTFADADANLQKLRIGKDRSDLVNYLIAEWNLKPGPF